jgi:hypothetical protein
MTQDMDVNNNNNAPYDILQAHHDHNKPNKPPLFTPMESDASDVDATDSEAEEVESDDNSAASDNKSEDQLKYHTRAKRHSQKAYGSSVSPTQLQFYPLQWTEVLELAKKKWRRYLLVKWAFPKRCKLDTTTVLKECLTTAIADHEADGGLVEKGTDDILIQSHYSR